MPSVVALIPARSGSKRVVDKNVRPLGGHPLMAYTIAAARASGVFDAVICSTDSERLRRDRASLRRRGAVPAAGGVRDLDLARHRMGRGHAEAPQGRRAAATIASASCARRARSARPETIQRAWGEFLAEQGVDSLRAVEKVTQHPGKMWVVRGKRMTAAAAARRPRRSPGIRARWRRCPRSTCRMRASRSPGRASCSTAAPSPASASCRSSPTRPKASTSTTSTIGTTPRRMVAQGKFALPKVDGSALRRDQVERGTRFG